ncbi:D-beta-hydroxybutyrate dehydrogenase, mitochondrial [Elysia marginata]|uniref:D-beta-hydroxybutyrate dehydrogenase, mitochondrial n=1 Tax=Elysia marginata TaxID=1093978 RepID=A0AAV4FNI4_9GAST|nr:D-beta-hydroxybutyrate dehydrogenase, mitochondrial [Elysia marginata]
MMKFRTAVAIFLALLATFFYLVQPWPCSGLTIVGQMCVYSLLLGLSLVLLWSTVPKRRVDPKGKAVFITGCDSGFGHELAQQLDSLGYTVFAGCLAPDREGARALKGSCSDRLKIVPIDVTDDFQVSQAVNFVKSNIGDDVLWAVVNNAGVAVFCEIEWCSVQEFQKIMDVNVFGIVRVTKGFLPLLRQSEGRVINVASLAGRFTLPAFAAYSMSKKACIAFSDGLRQEMKKFNITVVTIEPGLYKTPICYADNLINHNKKSWAETPTEVKKDYGEEYFDAFLKQVTISLKQARPNVLEVVDNMVEAVCVEHPSYRYVPYWRNQIRAFIISSLPMSMSDKLFARRFRMIEPESRKNKSPKGSKTPSPQDKTFWN